LLLVSTSAARDELLGGLAVLLAGLGYAIGGLLAKHRTRRPPRSESRLGVDCRRGPVDPGGDHRFPHVGTSLGPVAAVVTLGIVGTGIAFAIFYELIATVGPARTFIVTYLAPAFAVVYGVTLLDEEVTFATLGGLR